MEGHPGESMKLKVLYLQLCVSQWHIYQRLSLQLSFQRHYSFVSFCFFFLLEFRARFTAFKSYDSVGRWSLQNISFGSVLGSSSRLWPSLNLLAEVTRGWVEVFWSNLHPWPWTTNHKTSTKHQWSVHVQELLGAFHVLLTILFQIWKK